MGKVFLAGKKGLALAAFGLIFVLAILWPSDYSPTGLLTGNISVTVTSASAGGISIAQMHPSFNFLDVGNSTAQVNSIWVVINNSGGGNLNFVNVTFVMPFGINPLNKGNCNTTQQRIIGNKQSLNGTFNTTHQTCSIGYWNISNGATANVSLNVVANISALTMAHIAGGTNSRPGRIYSIINSSNSTNFVTIQTLHNSTSYWINPRPYAYAANAASNGTVYIMGFNQTRNGYFVPAPIMSFSFTSGFPTLIQSDYAEISFASKNPMEAAASSTEAMDFEIYSYNLTFRIVIPFAATGSTGTAQTYYINTPAVAANQTLTPMVTDTFTFPGMMGGGNVTRVFSFPVFGSGQDFSVYYAVNSSGSTLYHTNNLSFSKGITITYNRSYSAASPMLTITTDNVSALNNTDISILFTLMNSQTDKLTSPVFIQSQQFSGLDFNSPPAPGESKPNTILINISNALSNYTLSNVSVRFILPAGLNVVNGTKAGEAHTLTNLDNSSFRYSTNRNTYAYAPSWSGASNYTKSVQMTDHIGPMNNSGFTVNFSEVDVVLASHFNNWIPGSQTGNASFATLNFSMHMNFPALIESNSTANYSNGDMIYYNATIQMPQRGRLNLTGRVPNFTSSITNYNITIDGTKYTSSDQNITIGSLFANDLDAGSHSVSVSYFVPTSSQAAGNSETLPSGGTAAAAGSGSETAAAILDFTKSDTYIKGAESGTKYVVKIIGKIERTETGVAVQAPSAIPIETHTVVIDAIIGKTVKITISSAPITILVDEGETKKIDFEKDGEYDMKVFVRSIDEGKADIEFTSMRTLRALSYPAKISIPQSSDYLYTITVRNFGIGPHQKVSIKVEGEGSFDIIPKIVNVVTKGDTVVFILSIRVLPGAKPGYNDLVLRLSSDELNAEYKTLLNVVENPLNPFLEALDKDALKRQADNMQQIADQLWVAAIERQLLGGDVESVLALLRTANHDIAGAKAALEGGKLSQSQSLLQNAKQNIEAAVILLNRSQSSAQELMYYAIIVIAMTIFILLAVHYSRIRTSKTLIRSEQRKAESARKRG